MTTRNYKEMKRCVLFLLVLLPMSLYSQKYETAEQEQITRLRVLQKVGAFTGYLEDIANKGESLEYRLYYKDAALGLFIAEGQPYIYSGEKRDGVQIEIKSLNKTVSSYLLRDYLCRLANLNYSQIRILSTEVAKIKVSQLEKIDDETYMCVCFVKQVFVPKDDEVSSHFIYIQEKKIECVIN